MSSGNVFETLFRQMATILKLVVDGKRDPGDVSRVFQSIIDAGVNFLLDIDWQRVYVALGMGVEYTEAIRSLGVKEDLNLWTVPVIKGESLTCNEVVAALRKLEADVYTHIDDLDKAVPTNDRDPNRDGSYVIGFRRTIEADEENKNSSANTLKNRGHKGITLLERLLLELGYFLTTGGQHLDIKNTTLCSGSRDSDGVVPSVYWHSDRHRVYVDWHSPDSCSDFLRSRSAVSLTTKQALPA